MFATLPDVQPIRSKAWYVGMRVCPSATASRYWHSSHAVDQALATCVHVSPNGEFHDPSITGTNCLSSRTPPRACLQCRRLGAPNTEALSRPSRRRCLTQSTSTIPSPYTLHDRPLPLHFGLRRLSCLGRLLCVISPRGTRGRSCTTKSSPRMRCLFRVYYGCRVHRDVEAGQIST